MAKPCMLKTMTLGQEKTTPKSGCRMLYLWVRRQDWQLALGSFPGRGPEELKDIVGGQVWAGGMA